jgi:tripartite-type tricarboxylate transporter receptor subunit TctC
MTNSRRRFLHLAAGAAAVPFALGIARAQSYPSRPVRVIVAYPPGGPTDVCARVLAQWLSERLAQQFVVENRSGAGGNIGTEAALKSRADGYTILFAVSPNAINASLYQKLNFNFIRDIAPVASVARTTLMMEVNPSFPARSVPEFISYAKANPGKIYYASAGIGTPNHLAGELFKMMTGVEMQHVPYRGSAEALVDLVAGHVPVMFDHIASSIGHVNAGRLRPLAVTTATRSLALPDLPTVGDFVHGFEVSGWQGVVVPKDTPANVVETLSKEINAGLADPKLKARLADLGATVLPGSPADFGKFIAEETEKWAKVIKYASIRPE